MATLRTNSKEFMNRFAAYFKDTMETRISDYNESAGHDEYNEDSLTDCLTVFWQAFDEEVNYTYNKKRWPNLQARVANWLQGLPIGIAYTNVGIIDAAKSLGSVDENSTQKKIDAIVNNWFEFFAGKVIELSDKNLLRRCR